MPTLANSFNVNSAAADGATLTTGSFTPTAGDVIVVKAARENDVGVAMSTPTDSQGNTYTLRASDTSASRCHVWLWTAVAASSTSMTVSVGNTAFAWRSITVEHWTSAALAGTPAVSSPETGSGAPSAALVTTQDLSVVSWLNADFVPVSPAGRVYDSTSASPVEDGLHDKPGFYVAYYAYQNAASAGSQTLGLTSPVGQTWSMLGVEVLDAGGGGPTQDPVQAIPLAWQ